MQHVNQARLASTASAMGFEAWRRRPVYRAQCATAALANELCGIRLQPGQGLAIRMGSPDYDALVLFRALRPYRSAAANELRRDVARVMRERRKAQRVCVQ